MTDYLVDHNNYDHHPLHGEVLTCCREVLEHAHPAQVDPQETLVTGEGSPVCIALIPHRHLAGCALIVWSDEGSLQLAWALVGDLPRHDDIDLGAPG